MFRIEQFVDNEWKSVDVGVYPRTDEEAQNVLDELRNDPAFTMAQLRVSGTAEIPVIIDDPSAAGFIAAVSKHNCRNTFEINAERIQHFVRRISERGLSPKDVVIVLLNADDVHGSPMTDALMPGHNWQQYRDQGQVPIARGLAGREGIQKSLELFDSMAAEKLRLVKDDVPVVVVDHGVAEVFCV